MRADGRSYVERRGISDRRLAERRVNQGTWSGAERRSGATADRVKPAGQTQTAEPASLDARKLPRGLASACGPKSRSRAS
jgi:hypothetical protein